MTRNSWLAQTQEEIGGGRNVRLYAGDSGGLGAGLGPRPIAQRFPRVPLGQFPWLVQTGLF